MSSIYMITSKYSSVDEYFFDDCVDNYVGNTNPHQILQQWDLYLKVH